MKQLGQLASYCNVRGTLTAPVGVKVSVEVDPDAAAALADRTVLPPHSVLRQKKKKLIQFKLLYLQLHVHEIIPVRFRAFLLLSMCTGIHRGS